MYSAHPRPGFQLEFYSGATAGMGFRSSTNSNTMTGRYSTSNTKGCCVHTPESLYCITVNAVKLTVLVKAMPDHRRAMGRSTANQVTYQGWTTGENRSRKRMER